VSGHARICGLPAGKSACWKGPRTALTFVLGDTALLSSSTGWLAFEDRSRKLDLNDLAPSRPRLPYETKETLVFARNHRPDRTVVVQRQAGARCEGDDDNPLVVLEIQSQDLHVDTRPNRVFDQGDVRLLAGTEKTPAMLLDELAVLDPPQRREVAAALRSVAETFAGVPDAGDTADALRMLAYMLDSG
jgi:hypothetical protein